MASLLWKVKALQKLQTEAVFIYASVFFLPLIVIHFICHWNMNGENNKSLISFFIKRLTEHFVKVEKVVSKWVWVSSLRPEMKSWQIPNLLFPLRERSVIYVHRNGIAFLTFFVFVFYIIVLFTGKKHKPGSILNVHFIPSPFLMKNKYLLSL